MKLPGEKFFWLLIGEKVFDLSIFDIFIVYANDEFIREKKFVFFVVVVLLLMV